MERPQQRVPPPSPQDRERGLLMLRNGMYSNIDPYEGEHFRPEMYNLVTGWRDLGPGGIPERVTPKQLQQQQQQLKSLEFFFGR